MDVKAPLSLDAFNKLAFCLEGRDKLSKMLQYGSRALAFYILSADPKSDVGQRLHALYKVMQQSRKAFRLGKSLTYYKKLQALSGNKSLSEGQRYLQFVQNVGMLGYFVSDNVAFASKAKVLRFDAEELTKKGGVLWFCANVAGFFNAVESLNADVEKEKCVRDILASEEDAARVDALRSQLEALRSGRFKKLLAVLKVTCDLVVSSSTGGVRLAERITGSKLHDGIIGSVGCVSAAVVLYNTWPSLSVPKKTLPPSEKEVKEEKKTEDDKTDKFALWMHRRQRGESLSERLRSEVQMSAALWQIGSNVDENSTTGDPKIGGNSRRQSTNVHVASAGNGHPCPREVKPLLFFYKFLQPIGAADAVGDGNATSSSAQRKLRVNLPLTVVCERANAQEMVLWLRTDAQGNVVREEKTPLWRKKLHNDLLGLASASSASPSNSHEGDPVLAVRSVARWKSNNSPSSGSAVVLTRRTLDPVMAVPCELPICVQQFVHCRGSQASIYRIFWCAQERKCFAVNLTSSLKSTEAPQEVDTAAVPGVPAAAAPTNGMTVSTMAAMNAAFEAAMATAAQIARFYCVTVCPDERACARWPKLRGAAIAEGVQATSRVVEHVQLQLPTLRFHSMTVDFIKDTAGVWWLTRVVDFNASSSVDPPRDDGGFGSRDSAVLIPEALRTKHGRVSNEPQADDCNSPPRASALMRGDELNNALNSRVCFLCGCSCELTPSFRGQLEAMLKGQTGDDYKDSNTISIEASVVDEFRMTLTMALDTIFFMRQRGVALPVWEGAVSIVRKAQLRDVCDFPACMLCYRIYQQQNRLQVIARELHSVFSPPAASTSDRPEVDDVENEAGTVNTSVGLANSAASGLSAPQLLSTELRFRYETPKHVLDRLEAFRTETIPPAVLLRGDSPEMRPTWSILTPMRGADVDPTASQLRLVFFFHELQDAGPDLVPTDFFLEYQLGQDVTQVQLEGSKHHTPNRWQLCETRVHYLCATLDAFSDFCSHKRLLIKMIAKPSSSIPSIRPADGTSVMESSAFAGDNEGTRHRDKEEFVGYTLLSLRSVVAAAKWFGNSLQPESRTDYLLELHTASYGLLTLKLTVGLLVDPVPLAHVRDVLRDRVFLEEQPPRGVYWPPPSHYLGGLAVPRDWVGALMPSEYTKILPMRRREAPGSHPSIASSPTRTQPQTPTTPVVVPTPEPQPLLRRMSSELMEKTATASSPIAVSRTNVRRRMSNVPMGKSWAETARELALSGAMNGVLADGVHVEQVQSEYRSRSLHLMTVAMVGTTLSRACLAAKRIVFRVTEDTATTNFPTILLAAILRHASFANPVSTSCFPSTSLSNWKSPARFHFTRRYSVDRLLAEVKPGSLPMLALLGELLLVLIEDRALPTTVDASALEPLLEPFWQQDSGWRPIPRTRSSCLPEHRVIWNRAIRRWEAATGAVEEVPELATSPETPDVSVKPAAKAHSVVLAADIGDFRARTLALVLCELFEQMETLDNGYIEIAELRSLAKCLPEEEYFEDQFELDVGERERLSQEDIETIAGLVERERRLALRTLLHSLMESAVMVDALAQFDRVGSGEMSLEEFRELASEALMTQRKVFRAFLEEPKKSQDGFCLRHGFTETFATDSVCVLCATEFQAGKSPRKPGKSPLKSQEKTQVPIAVSTESSGAGDAVQAARDAARKFSGERAASGRTLEIEFSLGAKERPDSDNTRRASSPPRLERLRRLSSGKIILEEVPVEVDNEPGTRRRRAVVGREATTPQIVDEELVNMLNRLHAAERTIVTQVGDRKQSLGAAKIRQPLSTTNPTIPKSASCSDLKTLRRSTVATIPTQHSGQVKFSTDLEKTVKKKKRLKKKILKKTRRRLRPTSPLPAPSSLANLLRMEFTDRRRALATSASETIIQKAVRVEEKRKQLDRLVLAEVQEVKRRLARLLDDT
ncbi:hypothetical protein PF010_g15931 [Phytophthora fragariae]|uniref:EF-hand domain-containing protein n=1 Tax=Phytophthora fragariae TaxID=53985 RepID=A0A6G0KT96_9STRA|nr:hypothetical protein PF010_g15931 [Phytophthora fragariae]